MNARVNLLLRARLGAYTDLERAPIAALLMQALVTSVLCGLVRGDLPAFAYGVFALSISGALLAIPLLGELSELLTSDEADEWVRSQPVLPRDVRMARTLHLLVALLTLALGSLVPAALLAPGSMGLFARLLLVVGGIEQALVMAALLLAVHSILRGRARGLLVLVQTLLFVGVVVGAALGTRVVPGLKDLRGFADAGAGLLAWPQSWFAAPLADAGGSMLLVWIGPAAALVAVVLLCVVPEAPVPSERRADALLGRLLQPARRLAVRLWVRPQERASFEWIFDALPRERTFVLRAYPLVAVPLAFLLLGARGESGAAAEGLYALLCFTTAAYLPLIVAHLPASDSADARWLVESAPLTRAALEGGALKAVAVRLVLPLYVVLALLCWSQGGALLAVRLALPGALLALIVLRLTWRVCVRDTPLSVPPDELAIDLDWIGLLGGLGIGLTLLSVAYTRLLPETGQAAAAIAVLVVFELVLERAWHADHAPDAIR